MVRTLANIYPLFLGYFLYIFLYILVTTQLNFIYLSRLRGTLLKREEVMCYQLDFLFSL